MFLWRLTNLEPEHLDSFVGAVVRASTAEQANRIHPYDGSSILDHHDRAWPRDPTHIKVERLGEDWTHETDPVIMSDFRSAVD